MFGIFTNISDNNRTCKKNYSLNPSKRIVDDSVIVCDEIKNFPDSVSTNVTNPIT